MENLTMVQGLKKLEGARGLQLEMFAAVTGLKRVTRMEKNSINLLISL